MVATDAPLLPHQLQRLAKRPSLALGRLWAISGDGSGDIFIAFSTANAGQIDEDQFSDVDMYPNNSLSRVFEAAIQATEEAIVNAMVAAETVVGASGLRVDELPEEQVRAIFFERRKLSANECPHLAGSRRSDLPLYRPSRIGARFYEVVATAAGGSPGITKWSIRRRGGNKTQPESQHDPDTGADKYQKVGANRLHHVLEGRTVIEAFGQACQDQRNPEYQQRAIC